MTVRLRDAREAMSIGYIRSALAGLRAEQNQGDHDKAKNSGRNSRLLRQINSSIPRKRTRR